ncbi:MAG: DNA-binding domain-containing protein [Alphaproteobacteria bacterium]|nr:DNA-binding domain-containing protein [Alphaproteobacteria bacterium]MBU1824050.1 DNA-binding domain-containing protein [Alphaproteobacteria bacterium]
MREAQAAIAATLLRGPDHLPAGLFAGDRAAVLRGLRIHANTISHARLVALEETFPRTRDYLGEGEFNRLSRAFLDDGGAQRRSLARIGATFADWLVDPLAADLARVEWAWLESYHAPDAVALTLADLAQLDEAALLVFRVRRHSATRVVTLTHAAAPLVDPAFAAETRTLMVTRPDAAVLLHAVLPADAAVITMSDEMTPLGNLIARLAEDHPEGGAAIAALIAAGAFERV